MYDISTQKYIVEEICGTIDCEWSLIHINAEYEIIDGHLHSDSMTSLFIHDGTQWTEESICLSNSASLLLHKLRESMSDLPGGPWSICTLEVADTGRYKFSFSYDKPVRLYDMLAGNTQFADYDPAARYKALTTGM